MQQPFPFQQLPADLQRLIAREPGIFSRLAPLSRESRQLVYNPQVLRVKCQLPPDIKEVIAVADFIFYQHNNFYFLSPPPTDPADLADFFKHPTILAGHLTRHSPRSIEEVIEPLALNYLTGLFFGSTDSSLYQNNLAEAIRHLWFYGISGLPAVYLLAIYQRRVSCLNLNVNYAMNKVLEDFDRDSNEWLRIIQQDKRLSTYLLEYLKMFIQGLNIEIETFIDPCEMSLDEIYNLVLEQYRIVRDALPEALRSRRPYLLSEE